MFAQLRCYSPFATISPGQINKNAHPYKKLTLQ